MDKSNKEQLEELVEEEETSFEEMYKKQAEQYFFSKEFELVELLGFK